MCIAKYAMNSNINIHLNSLLFCECGTGPYGYSMAYGTKCMKTRVGSGHSCCLLKNYWPIYIET